MKGMTAIAFREVSSLFRLPVGWVVIALYLFLGGVIVAWQVVLPGQPSTMRLFFAVSGWLFLPVAPAISMRLISEELRVGTFEALATAPVSDSSIILGKYLGGCLFLVAMLAPTVVYPVLLMMVSDPAPDPGPILAGYLSLVLLGALYLAVGLFASALTSSQTLAFIGTLLALLIVLLLTTFVARGEGVPEWVRAGLSWMSITRRLDDFARGIIDVSHVVFFVGGVVWFLALSVMVMHVRRWW